LKAALDGFLAHDYHEVTTRHIAERAGTNVSMIRYYFGNKSGLYEEMIRDTMRPLMDALDSGTLASTEGFAALFRLYYRIMGSRPEFPKLILKVLALNQGPGRSFLEEFLKKGRVRGARRLRDLKSSGQVDGAMDPDVVRMAFVSLAMMPMLLKEIFEKQLGRPLDEGFLDALAAFNGHLFAAGLTTGGKG
jgi:AcrR family transcriptional regulator